MILTDTPTCHTTMKRYNTQSTNKTKCQRRSLFDKTSNNIDLLNDNVDSDDDLDDIERDINHIAEDKV